MVNAACRLAMLGMGLAIVSTGSAAATAPRSSWTAVSIKILKNGVRSVDVSGDETARDCASFKLTTRDVRVFFSRADRVNERGYHHDLPMSPCQSSGTIRFANGWRGSWSIDRARRGRFVRAGAAPVYFYCIGCMSTKFDELDSEDRDVARSVMVR